MFILSLESVESRDIRKTEEKLHKFKEAKKILIVPSEDILKREPEEIEVWDWKEFLRISKF